MPNGTQSFSHIVPAIWNGRAGRRTHGAGTPAAAAIMAASSRSFS